MKRIRIEHRPSALFFGLACCGIETIAAGGPRHDLARFPVDIYLPGCPPRPEMLIDAIVKLHDKIENMELGVHRDRQITELEQARLRRLPLEPGHRA